MSLEKLVKEFAERVRAELLMRIEAEKNTDAEVVEWQGFDADGKPTIKNSDKIETATGLGNVAQRKGTKLIYDKNSSVEYKKRKRKELPPIKKQEIPAVVRRKRISRSLMLTADLFGTAEELFDIPSTGFYMITYGTVQPDFAVLISNVAVFAGGFVGGSQQPETITRTLIVDDYTSMATGSSTYRISLGAVAFRSEAGVGGVPDGTASASVTGLGINLSVNGSGNATGTAVALNVQQTTAGGSSALLATGKFELTGPPNYVQVNLGEGSANLDFAYISLQRAIYYFQMPNNTATGQAKVRQIDLNKITPNRVYESRIVHNYVSREANDVFVYTIYYVLDLDMSQQYEIRNTNTQSEKDIIRLIGKVTKYIVHTKLNMSTGKYEYKINESPDTGTFTTSGQLIPYDRYGPETGSGGTWLIRVSAHAKSVGPLFASGHQIAAVSISQSAYRGFAKSPNSRFNFNPEAIWRESYEGDWLYVHRNLTWDATAAANVSDQDIQNFLNLSYKNGFFWMYYDSELGSYSTPPFFKRKNIVGSGWEGNTPLTGTYADIVSMYSFTNSVADSTSYLWSDYFDGTVPNVPGDYSSWRTWTLAEQNHTTTNIANYSGTYGEQQPSVDEYSYTLPNFSLAANVLEAGDPVGNRLSYPKTWFNFVPVDSIRLISYQITTETINNLQQQVFTLTTASRGYAFSAGDVIKITEDAAINGLYSIYQVTSTTQFKVILPGSANTSGVITTTGIATKLPPAT